MRACCLSVASFLALACAPKAEADRSSAQPQPRAQVIDEGGSQDAEEEPAEDDPYNGAAALAAQAEADAAADAEEAAYAAAEELGEEEERAKQARLAAAFAGCSDSKTLVDLRALIDAAVEDNDAYLEVETRGEWSIIQLAESGSGMDASDRLHAMAVSPSSCSLGAEVGYTFNGPSAVGNVDKELRGASADARAALEAELGIRAFKRKDPAHALVALYLGKGRPRKMEMPKSVLVGPLFRKPAWFAGPPTEQLSVIVPKTAAIAKRFIDTDEPKALITAGGEAPKKTASFGGVEIYEAELGGRNGGVAVALYDAAKDRHRWILETRHRLVASHIDWLGQHDGLVVGETRSDHPGEYFAGTAHIVAVRLRDGAVFTLHVPGVFEHGQYLNDGEEATATEDASYACAEKAVAAQGLDDSSEEGVAMLQEAYETCEETHAIPPRIAVTKSALRIRETDTAWIDIPWEELTKVERRLRF